MPFGVDDAVMLAPAAISIAQQLFGGQQGAQKDAMQLQMENLAFQREQARRQYELATAGRTNARGDQTRYIPDQGWVVLNSPDTASRITNDNRLNTLETERQLSVNEPERNRASTRRVHESSAAEPLLSDFAQGYGMPTRGGVKGKNAIAAATAATEASDLNQNAAMGAALRTGSRMPVSGSAKGATGLRTALAGADASGDQMYESMLKAAQGNKLDPYNMLATRASGETPRLPESLSGDLNSGLANAAAVGAMRGVGTGAGVGDATKGLAAQLMIGGQQQPSYDAFAGVLAKVLKGKFGFDNGGSSDPMNDYLTNKNRDASYHGGGGF